MYEQIISDRTTHELWRSRTEQQRLEKLLQQEMELRVAVEQKRNEDRLKCEQLEVRDCLHLCSQNIRWSAVK